MLTIFLFIKYLYWHLIRFLRYMYPTFIYRYCHIHIIFLSGRDPLSHHIPLPLKVQRYSTRFSKITENRWKLHFLIENPNKFFTINIYIFRLATTDTKNHLYMKNSNNVFKCSFKIYERLYFSKRRRPGVNSWRKRWKVSYQQHPFWFW